MKKKLKIIGYGVLAILLVIGMVNAYRRGPRTILVCGRNVPAVEAFLEEHWPVKEKFWLHRTDCLEKLRERGGKYAGVEFDLNWHADVKNFDVSHDKQETVEYPLADFLRELPKGEKIWFDFKNLDAANAEGSLSVLTSLLETSGVDKKAVIIENGDCSGLSVFHDAGYYTSFYVPVEDELLKTEEGNILFAKDVRAAVATGAVDAVSFPGEYYHLVRRLELPVDLLTWFPWRSYLDFYWKDSMREIMEDPKVKVILIYDEASANR